MGSAVIVWMILTALRLTTAQISKELGDAGTDLGFKLYHEATKEAENVFLSPYSISTALALTYQGAKGDTKQELSDTLGFSKLETLNLNADYQAMNDAILETKEYTLEIANRLYGQSGMTFLQSFLNPLQQYYNAPLEQKDFARQPEKSREEINEWVKDQTENMIKDLLPQGSVDTNTDLVLVNAIYFKGNWVKQFKEKDTKEEYFHISSNQHVKVPMMKLKNKSLKIYHDIDMKAKILQLPYDGNDNDEIDEGDDIAMYIILPDESDGLNDVTRDFNSAKLNKMIDSMSYERVDLVKMPRFNITQRLELKKMLKVLGMEKAFTSEADFSGMTGHRGLFINEVYHQAVVEVDEKGTTAAAATAVVMGKSAALNPLTFEADHPFLFLIREESTASTLFMGRVQDPSTATL